MNFRLVFYSQLSSQRIWSFPGLTFTSSKICLITIWQTHIQQWYGESDLPQPQPTVKPDSTDDSEHPIVKLGGVFCCRCGRSTKLIKHQRFKFLSKVCTFPDLPPVSFAVVVANRLNHLNISVWKFWANHALFQISHKSNGSLNQDFRTSTVLKPLNNN